LKLIRGDSNMFLVDFHKMSDSQVAIFPNVSGKRRLVFKCFYCI